MKQNVLIDTSAWLALINKTDEFHLKAQNIRDQLLQDKAISWITDYVLVEIANSLSKLRFRKAAVQLINSIHFSKDINIVRINQEIYHQAWELYSDRMDKEWGLTDCTSFIVMQRNQINKAFTSDHHFEQAGFFILLT